MTFVDYIWCNINTLKCALKVFPLRTKCMGKFLCEPANKLVAFFIFFYCGKYAFIKLNNVC